MDQQVGRYKIVGKLGKGAMGMVFLAEDPLLNRQVAMKTIDLSVEDPSQREFLRDRLLRDARAAAALSHPHIVSVFDVVDAGQCAWLVMEYIAGETLAQRMAGGPLEPGFALRILTEVAAALDYTHARGVIHRDIKPSNIMIDAFGAAKIMDFGIARLSEGRTTTPTGMVMGTIEYMAPEQIKGEPVDGRADQFALAAVAYQVMTGSTLFGPQSMTTLTYKLVHEAPPPARSRNPRLPVGVDEVLSRALSKQPAERFVNCAGFVAALQAALYATQTAAAPTERTAAQPAGGKKWLWVGLAAALLVAGLLALGNFVLKQWQNSTEPVASVAQPVVSPPAEQPKSMPPQVTPGATTEPATTKPEKAPAPAITPEKASAPGAAPPAKRPEPPADEPAFPVVAAPPIDASPAAPGDDEHALAQARALIENRQFDTAISLLTKSIATHPRSPTAYELRALANQEQKLFESAIQDYTANLRLNPTHAYALHQRAVCYVQLKQDDAALADLNKALELHPHDFAATYITRGFIYNRKRAYKKAIEDFDQAIQQAPKEANAYRGRMISRRATGDMAGAALDEKKFNELKRR
jgi:serine/threonine-protein kinase